MWLTVMRRRPARATSFPRRLAAANRAVSALLLDRNHLPLAAAQKRPAATSANLASNAIVSPLRAHYPNTDLRKSFQSRLHQLYPRLFERVKRDRTAKGCSVSLRLHAVSQPPDALPLRLKTVWSCRSTLDFVVTC